jgi:hypothetical protein
VANVTKAQGRFPALRMNDGGRRLEGIGAVTPHRRLQPARRADWGIPGCAARVNRSSAGAAEALDRAAR